MEDARMSQKAKQWLYRASQTNYDSHGFPVMPKDGGIVGFIKRNVDKPYQITSEVNIKEKTSNE